MLPPLLVEGLRGETIGTDMVTYAVPFFNTLKGANSILDVPVLIQHSDYAYLYLTYFCAKCTGSLSFFLILCALIKLVLVYTTAYRLRNHIFSGFFIFSYYFYFYVLGFSLMRQSLAIAFCIYSLYYFFEKKYIHFLIITIIAYLFHNSAILMLLLPLVYMIGKMRYNYIISVVIPLLIYFFISDIMEMLISSPLFTAGKVEMYIDSGVPTEKTSIVIAFFFVCVAFFMLFKRKDPQTVFLLISFSIYAIVFLFLASYIEVAFRMAYYMLIVNVLLTLYLIKEEKIWYINIGYLCVFLLHFMIACKYGLYDTIPYHSILEF